MVVCERQVLPRGMDHGRDLALLADDLPEGEDIMTLVLDFSNAFMSIPLHPEERRFNCANAGFTLRRRRPPLYEGEPEEGTFVVWRTLGFGGKPNPLVFSRVASFASRTTQALIGQDNDEHVDLATGRLQLYVDDPVLSGRGTKDRLYQLFDLVILWWLVLGIPLAWAKGSLTTRSEPHRWIGIMYHLVPEGCIMRLTPEYVAGLLLLLGHLGVLPAPIDGVEAPGIGDCELVSDLSELLEHPSSDFVSQNRC